MTQLTVTQLSVTQLNDDQKIQAVAPYTSLFRDTILTAKEMKASDIHIQPTREGVDIRLRVNGDMVTWKQLGLDHRKAFVNEVKRLTNLSLAVSGKAQDGRISYQAWQLDLRTSLLPSQYGEKIVLRLLDLTRKFELKALGFDDRTEADLVHALTASHGVLIISGPTGSGKTTTLYTLLCALDRYSKNIITLEDPIEYGIPGLTQVQVSRKLSFADALRAVLRQDPDVILVGEIRDAETADLCMKAAATGHFVMSTLHANGAFEVVGRLLNLGVDVGLLKSVLRFSAAQRLVKKLCPECSVVVKEGMLWRKRNSPGCERCQLGIVGRVPILEYMQGRQIEQCLESGSGSGSGAVHPVLSSTLREAAMRRAEKGEIDYEEALGME